MALRTLVAVMLGSNQAMFVAWGPERTMLYNDRYAAICGARHPAAMGAPFRAVWFDIMDEVGPILERAFAGVPTQMDDIAFTLHRNGYPEEAHFAFSYTPVRGDTGAVEGMFCACAETTEAVLAGRRAAAERERQRLMLLHMPGFCALLSGPEHRYEYVNEAYVEIAGRRDFVGRTVREVFPDIAGQGFFELLDRVYATGERFAAHAMPIRLDRPDGDRFIDLLYEPVRDDAGRVAGIFVGGHDVTERVRGEAALRRGERRYRSFVEASAQIIWRVNAAGEADEPMPAWEAYTGQDFGQARGMGWMDAIREGDRPAVAAAWRRAIAGGGTYEVEYALRRHDGTWRRVLARGVPVREEPDALHPEGRIVEWIGTCIDIEDRRTAEARLALALEGSSDGLWDWDIAGGTVYHSPRWIEMLGYAPETWESTYANWLAHTHPDDVGPCEDYLRRYLAGETAEYQNLFRMRHRDGRWLWMLSRAKVHRGADGQPLRMVGTHTDVTERIEAERRQAFLLDLAERLQGSSPREALAGAVALLGERLGVSRAGYGELDEAGEAVLVMHEHARGGAQAALGTHRLEDFGPAIAAELRRGRTLVVADVLAEPRTRAGGAAHLAIGTRSVVTVPLVREGRLRATLYLNHAEPREWTAAEVALVEEVAARTWAVLERARAEEALRASEARFRAAQETSVDGFMILEPLRDAAGRIEDFRIAYANAAAERLTARPPGSLAGRRVLEELPGNREAGLFDAYVRLAEGGEGWAREIAYGLDGVEAQVRLAAVRVGQDGVAITFGDVSEWRRAEAALRRLNEDLERRVREEVAAREEAQLRLAHAQRMEALGQLAGGIAHDFNNVLQAVQGGARLIEARPGDTERVRRLVGMMAEAAARGSAVTRRLLAFSRRADLRAEPLDAAELLGGLAEVLSHTMGDGIRVEMAAPAGLPPLVADKGGLETVIVNLAANARDATGGQGTITLSAALERVATGGRRPPVRLPPGEYLRLSVRDGGVGMAPEVLARVTEPFFTTKPNGKGTGLGLAMARGFAEQSGGALHIESAPGAGTTVSLWLPVAEARAVAATSEGIGTKRAGLRARVLLVDDDPVVREIVAEGLRTAGYEVTALAGAADALDLLDGGGPVVDVLVSDLSMPGMDGLALVEEVHRRRPGLPAILLTGFATDAAELAMRGAVSGAFSLLRKPIEAADLADRIAALLSGAEANGG